MTLEDALSYIHRVDWRGSVPGLERIGALLGAGTVWVVAKAGPALFRAVGSLCRTLFGKVR